MRKNVNAKTSKTSVEARLIASARQAVEIAKGRAKPARAYSLPRTARETVVEGPKAYDRHSIVSVREKLGLSQAVFARAIGKSAPTVRSWEQGVKVPDPAASRMLEIAERHPKVILEFVKSAVASHRRNAADAAARARR